MEVLAAQTRQASSLISTSACSSQNCIFDAQKGKLDEGFAAFGAPSKLPL
jgi:hypothetical protein